MLYVRPALLQHYRSSPSKTREGHSTTTTTKKRACGLSAVPDLEHQLGCGIVVVLVLLPPPDQTPATQRGKRQLHDRLLRAFLARQRCRVEPASHAIQVPVRDKHHVSGPTARAVLMRAFDTMCHIEVRYFRNTSSSSYTGAAPAFGTAGASRLAANLPPPTGCSYLCSGWRTDALCAHAFGNKLHGNSVEHIFPDTKGSIAFRWGSLRCGQRGFLLEAAGHCVGAGSAMPGKRCHYS